MTTVKQKLLLFILGLIIFPLLFEICLRTGAEVYYRLAITSKEEIVSEDKNYIRILSLGDSFCFGLGAPFDGSFPLQLQNLLNKNRKEKFIVYNRGIPGQSSSQVLKNLEKNIQRYKPDIIILIVGMNDKGNLEDSNYFLFKKPKNLNDIFLKLDAHLSRLRSYELLKQFTLRFKNKIKLIISKIIDERVFAAPEDTVSIDAYIQSARRYLQDYESDLALEKVKKALQLDPNNIQAKNELLNIYCFQRKFDLVINELKKILEKAPDNLGYLCYLANIYCQIEDYDLAFSTIEEAIKINPKDPNAHHTLGKCYYLQGRNRPETKEKNFKLAINEYKKSIAYSDKANGKGWAYCDLASLYWEEGEINLAINTMMKALDCQPQNKHFWFMLRNIRSSRFSQKENEIFNQLLYYNLSNIYKITQSTRGIKLILLGYPSSSHQDEVRKRIAEKYKISFIDFATIFNELLSEGNYKYKDLFSDDANHCNTNGYKIIAEEIYKVIIGGMSLDYGY